jgi:hypothetical protein
MTDAGLTNEQRDQTLAAIEVMRSLLNGEYGPIGAAVAVMHASEHVGIDGLIIGLTDLVVLLAEHIEATTDVSPSETLAALAEAVR